MHDNTYLCSKLAFHQLLQRQLLPDHRPPSLSVASLTALLSFNYIAKQRKLMKFYNILVKFWIDYLMPSLFVLFIEVELNEFSFVVKVSRIKSSTGVANMNNETAATSRAPVPTSVCFSIFMTGFTYINKFLQLSHARNIWKICSMTFRIWCNQLMSYIN